MSDFTQGGEWLSKIEEKKFHGEIYISLSISIDRLQPTCMYQLSVKRGPQSFSLGLALVELV